MRYQSDLARQKKEMREAAEADRLKRKAEKRALAEEVSENLLCLFLTLLYRPIGF